MKILIAQTGFLGDVVLSTPVIAALKHFYPHAELWMLTTPQARPLVKRDPLLKGVLVFEKRGYHKGALGLLHFSGVLRSMKFDKAFALHRSYRTSILLYSAGVPERTGFKDSRLSFLYNHRVERPSNVHDVLRRMAIVDQEKGNGARDVPLDLRLFPPEFSECSVEMQKAAQRERQYAVLVPGSEWETKRWQWQGYREAASFLIKRGLKVVICGSESEREYNKQVSLGLDVVDLTGRITLDDFLFTVKNSALLLCNDSLALHVGSAFKIPTLVIFCATSPSFGFGPWLNDSAVIVEKQGLECKPCRRHGSRRCPTGTWKCSKELEAAEVIRIVEERVLPQV